MAKGQRKSNREVRKPKKAVEKGAAQPAGYLSAGLGKPLKLEAKSKKK